MNLSPSQALPPPGERRASTLAASQSTHRAVLWIVVGCVLLLSGLIGWLATEMRTQRHLLDQLADRPISRTGRFHHEGAIGPWGKLEYVEIDLERPAEFVFVPSATNQSRWLFEASTTNDLKNLFQSAPLSPSQRAWLLEETHWQYNPEGVLITPPREIVLTLDPKARRKIYGVLSLSAQNQFQLYPFAQRADRLERWFADSGLEAKTVEQVKRMLFPRGNSVCFSDLFAILPELPTPEERCRLIKTLSRTSTLLVKLRVDERSDIDALLRYWDRGGRAKDLRPLLESLARVRGGATIDLTHLLPALARRLLYTYPYPTNDPQAVRPNCFWTSMNFFNEQPDDRLANFDFVEQVLLTDYYPVEGQPTLGDVVLLSAPNGGIFHAAVYIADGIVLTKNGKHFSYPWVLMKLDDLLAFYPFEKPVDIITYRLKRL
ncbi:MAG: hypothetical protein HYY24_18170 [Verrucomicrobia bacterium]|nr:hypothetical protein [Verrucomicrobiota bacterium]